MFFDKNVICKGKDYSKGKVQGVLCFSDAFSMQQKRDGIATIPVVFNNHKIGVESIINCDGIIVFEDCFNGFIKEIIDKTKVPCILLPRENGTVEKVSILVGKKLSASEGETVLLDGKKVCKVIENV